LKIAAVAAVLFVALGAIAFAYAGSQSSVTANEDVRQMDIWKTMGFSGWNNVTLPDNVTMPCHMGRMPHMRANGPQWFNMLSENATLSTVNGTVVSEVNSMLILNTDTTQIRVLLPKEWTVGNDIVDSASLFNGSFASAGQSVTVKVLESDLFSNANFSVNVMLGYEAINATAVHAYAVLPFNIQPNS
jgi:hypothetical protein